VKQQSKGRHVPPLGHMIPSKLVLAEKRQIPILSYLVWPSKIYHTRGEHANFYTTDMFYNLNTYYHKRTYYKSSFDFICNQATEIRTKVQKSGFFTCSKCSNNLKISNNFGKIMQLFIKRKIFFHSWVSCCLTEHNIGYVAVRYLNLKCVPKVTTEQKISHSRLQHLWKTLHECSLQRIIRPNCKPTTD